MLQVEVVSMGRRCTHTITMAGKLEAMGECAERVDRRRRDRGLRQRLWALCSNEGQARTSAPTAAHPHNTTSAEI